MNFVSCPIRTPKGEAQLFDDVAVYSVNEYTQKSEYTTNKKHKVEYLDIFGTFDIETTSMSHWEDGKEIPDFAYMYVWQACIDGVCVTGRTWDDFRHLLQTLKDTYDLSDEKRMVIFVHNLAFEFQFMNGYFQDYSELFAMGARIPLKWALNDYGIEFRCSYKLTNMSLYKFTENIPDCVHVKAKGDLDYKKIRTSVTPLTEEEWGYCVNDVLGLWEAISGMMKRDDDTIASMPLTSTSYVRRDVKSMKRRYRTVKLNMDKIVLDKQSFDVIQKAFRGGDTHASKIRCGKTYHDIYSFDATSMYPAMQLLMKFPVTRFEKYIPKKGIFNMINGRAWFCHIRLTNVRIKDNQYNPYLSESKCKPVINCDNDNGRIWSADSLDTYITDIDWDIINQCYDYDKVYVLDNAVWVAQYGMLPNELRKVIKKYFKAKCELKAEIKRLKAQNIQDIKAIADAEYRYMKSKNKLNAIYGMSATNPIHQLVKYNGTWICEDDPDIDFEKDMKDAVIPYQWGVWTTAHARMHLRRMLDCVGGDYIYCDTDSCKSISVDFEKLEKLNKWVYSLCEKNDAYVDVDGKRYYIGYFDNESELESDKVEPEYRDFITWGAKRYGYNKYGKTRDKVELGFTISGVAKNRAIAEIQTLDRFRPGYTILDSGGSVATYCDNQFETVKEVTDYNGVKSKVSYCGYNCLTHREYTLDLTNKQKLDYKFIDYIVA